MKTIPPDGDGQTIQQTQTQGQGFETLNDGTDGTLMLVANAKWDGTCDCGQR